MVNDMMTGMRGILVIIIALSLIALTGCQQVRALWGVGDIEANNKFFTLMEILKAVDINNVTVGAVIDMSTYDYKDTQLLSDVKKRTERRVRNAIVTKLTAAGLFIVRSASNEDSTSLRKIITDANTGTLDPKTAELFGKKLLADAILNVIIDDQGKRITVYVTRVADGNELFNKTFKEWNYARFDQGEDKPPKEKPTAEEAAQ